MKYAIIPCICVLFISCFQEKTELIIYSNLSTVITSEIKIPNAVLTKIHNQHSSAYFSNRTIVDEHGIIIPESISKKGFKNSLPDGAVLKNHSVKKNKKDTTVLFRIACKNKSASENILSNRISFAETGGFVSLNFCAVDISPDQDKPDQDGFDPKKEYAGYTSVITIKTPEPIEQKNCGTLSPDGKTFIYSYPVLKGADIPNGIIIISWKKK